MGLICNEQWDDSARWPTILNDNLIPKSTGTPQLVSGAGGWSYAPHCSQLQIIKYLHTPL